LTAGAQRAESGEWTLHDHEWFMVRVAECAGYWLQAGAAARQLAAGDCLIAAGTHHGALRASQLAELKLQFFIIQPQPLSGLLTVAEGHQLEAVRHCSASSALVFTADEPLAQRFRRLAEQPHRDGLPWRCGLLQLWATAVTGLLPGPVKASANGSKLRERFRELVSRMPEAGLSRCSLHDLARQLNCNERHLGRLFSKELGMPFHREQSELRLLKAGQLLGTTNLTVARVARDCGYHSLSLFNFLFKKRFGKTPSAWRQKSKRPA
jgi:AraC-like DNA-binding protein